MLPLLTKPIGLRYTKIKAVCPRTKILVLTDNDQQGQAAREAGADYYLLKGFPASELAHIVETSLIHDSGDETDLSNPTTNKKE